MGSALADRQKAARGAAAEPRAPACPSAPEAETGCAASAPAVVDPLVRATSYQVTRESCTLRPSNFWDRQLYTSTTTTHAHLADG